MAFLELPEAMEADWHNVTFSNTQEIESLSVTNYAFCQVREFYLIGKYSAVSCLQSPELKVIVFALANRLLAVYLRVSMLQKTVGNSHI